MIVKPRTAMVPLKRGIFSNASGIIVSIANARRIPPESASRAPATPAEASANNRDPRTAAKGVTRLAAPHTETM
jgi:hypothetical protein